MCPDMPLIETPRFLGVYTAIENQTNNFIFTIPKDASDSLELKGSEPFDVLFDRKHSIISYKQTEDKFRPKKRFDEDDDEVYLGTYSAMKSSPKHFLFSIPKYVREKLQMVGGETFSVTFYKKDRSIIYRREIITKKRKGRKR